MKSIELNLDPHFIFFIEKELSKRGLYPFYALVLMSLRDEGSDVEIHVTNDSLSTIEARIEWKLRNNKSEILAQGNVQTEVNNLTAKQCERLSLDKYITEENKRNLYLECTLYVNGEQTSVSTLMFTKPKHFNFIDPELTFNVIDKIDTFEITISSQAFAKYIEIDLKAADCKFSDNFFDLSRGEVRTVKVKKESLSESLSLESFKDQLQLRSVYDIV